MKLLVANRGEISVRIANAARDLAISTVSIYTPDDHNSRHASMADEAVELHSEGVPGYLDVENIIDIAKSTHCDAVHPGYGLLSEVPYFARACEDAGITFVGPTPETLSLFGNKHRARQFAESLHIPVMRGISEAVGLDKAQEFFLSLPHGSSILLKAVSGGGGRGMRQVHSIGELPQAVERASSEAEVAFGDGRLYVEELMSNMRHIELQIVGDGTGRVQVIGDRDCSLQRRHQKIVEIAPASSLSDEVRDSMWQAARQIGKASKYRSLGTIEFLADSNSFYFMEANARLQVEHTITEESAGIDLVALQLKLAMGQSLQLLSQKPNIKFAIQSRVNLEVMNEDGTTRPSGGTLTQFTPPTGPGIRVDTYGYPGYPTNPRFDSLIAKVICTGDSLADALSKSKRALKQFDIQGVGTNKSFLLALLNRSSVEESSVHTRFVDENITELLKDAEPHSEVKAEEQSKNLAGTRLQSNDPLAVLDHGKSDHALPSVPEDAIVLDDTTPIPIGTTAIRAPMQGTVVQIDVEPGEQVARNAIVLIMEAMKMEHEIRSEVSGCVHSLNVSQGDAVYESHALMFVEAQEIGLDESSENEQIDLDDVRSDVAEVIYRHEVTLDEHRPDAIEKRRRTHQRTARENVGDLCDVSSFVEHGQLALTPGTGLSQQEVIRKFPTDGMITGIGSVNGALFGNDRSRTVVMAYDYTVLAGTQGAINHPKTDRMLELAEKWRIPVVLFAEGGGGRAGTGGQRQGGKSTTRVGQGRDEAVYRPLDTPTFASMGRLSGLVPLIGITSRFCFAGNASLLGCCDVIIATENSNIGMGGPALIEGGNLGVFRPEEVGPLDVQRKNGVIDIVVKDEEEAVSSAKKYLSYFQGSVEKWDCEDQRKLRHIVPENRLRIYNVRDVIHTMADVDSVLELRPDFGLGMVTAFIRIEGRPIGVLANNPNHLAGAIDSDGSDKAARFLQLCDGFDIPVLVLCDTPGMMVGPEIEKTALVRHCSRLFVTGANLTVPHVTIVLRKAYGLGAQAMAGGSFKDPFASVAWPTAEFGGMGLEGQVKLGFRNELAAIEDPQERKQRYDELVEAAYQRGKALVAGTSFAVDDVIDPADSRRWLAAIFASVPAPPAREGKKRRNIDTW